MVQISDAIWNADWFSNGWNKMATKIDLQFENRSRFQMIGPFKLEKVCFSSVSGNQMLSFQIPTVYTH
jgi:hypothetical protein